MCWTQPLALGWQKGLILAGQHCVGCSRCPSEGCVSPLSHTCKLPYLSSRAKKSSAGRDQSLPESEGVSGLSKWKQLEFD